MSDVTYRCVRCAHAPLEKLRNQMRCVRCDAAYPLLFHVPLCFADMAIKPSRMTLVWTDTARICTRFRLQHVEAIHYILNQIFSYDYGLSNGTQCAEQSAALTAPRRATTQLHEDLALPGALGLGTFANNHGELFAIGMDIHALQVLKLALSIRCRRLHFVAAEPQSFPITGNLFSVKLDAPSGIAA